MKTIDIFGLKNYRIFDDQTGFSEEFAKINILTGANNSGKSSIVKALQMLKNSAKGYRYPFDLDLNQQEHLLGDFNNVLFDKTKKEIDITLPFLFFGITNLYVSLSFIIPQSNNPYEAKLRSIEVSDKADKQILFAFRYRNATDAEKVADKMKYEEDLEKYKTEEAELSKLPPEEAMFKGFFFQPPHDNPLVAYVDYQINLEKLNDYFTALQPFYAKYLEDKSSYDDEELERIDCNAEDKKLFCIPSAVFKGFKRDLDIQKWANFNENTLKDRKEIIGKEQVGERDFDQDELFIPRPEIEHNLYQKALHILRNNLVWQDGEEERTINVVEHCFSSAWDKLIQRISAINYISNIKEENARGYNAASNSPFISLLKGYISKDIDAKFLEKYLRAFEIGNYLIVDFQPMYQLILVSINTLDGQSRELVDFGYGIKQIILILIQVTVLAKQNKRVEQRYSYDGDYDHISYEPSLLIIEEPESNLHPKWQSLLADMFSEASRKFNIQLIIETHSEYLIRKFQTLVAKKIVKSQDVKIFYLRSLRNVTQEKKQVECLHIQEDGGIDFNAFDSGFFDENYKLNMSLLNVQFYKEFEDLKNAKEENEAKFQEREVEIEANKAKIKEGEDKIQDNENKINELEQKIDEYISKADVTRYRHIIISQYPNYNKLDLLSIDYLVAGQYLLENVEPNGDYSPVILQYGRAIENELKQIFYRLNSSGNWMFGKMQGSLEKLIIGSTTFPTCNASEFNQLTIDLGNMFNNHINLRYDLIDNLRNIRNDASHAGQKKTKQQASTYITMANDFLDRWISEMK